jgi:hypothetical protein
VSASFVQAVEPAVRQPGSRPAVKGRRRSRAFTPISRGRGGIRAAGSSPLHPSPLQHRGRPDLVSQRLGAPPDGGRDTVRQPLPRLCVGTASPRQTRPQQLEWFRPTFRSRSAARFPAGRRGERIETPMSELLQTVDALTSRLLLIAMETGVCPVCRAHMLDPEQHGHVDGCELAEVVLLAVNARTRSHLPPPALELSAIERILRLRLRVRGLRVWARLPRGSDRIAGSPLRDRRRTPSGR